MMNFRKTKGLVTGLLAVALSFTALGAAQAKVADESATPTRVVKINEQFTLGDAIGATDPNQCGADYSGCNFAANGERILPDTDPTTYAALDPSITQLGTAADMITFTANALGTFTINITGTQIGGAEKVFESTYTVKVTYGTVVDVAAGTAGFSTLVTAVTKAGLVDTLSAPVGEMNPAGYTVFAPTDAAFAKLSPVLVRALLLPKNKDLLVRILKYHVVPAQVMSGDLPEGLSDPAVATLDESNTLAVVKTTTTVDSVDTVAVTVNGANVVSADVPATNGVIHAIDTVLLPADIAAAIPAFLAPSYKVSITGYAYNAKGKSTRDDRRAAAVASYMKSLGGATANAQYVLTGTVLKKNSVKARSAVISVTKTLADGTSTTVTKTIYFTKSKTSLRAKSKTTLKAFAASI